MNMNKYVRFLITEFLYNGHLQSLGAGGLVVIATKLLFNTSASVEFFLATYALFETIFIFDRYHDLDWDSLTNTVRSKHLLLYRNKIPYIFAFYIIVFSSLYFYFSGPVMLLVSVIVCIAGIFYPVYFKKLTKKIPLFKNVYVSAVYMPLAFFPAIYLMKAPVRDVLALHLPIVVFVESFIAQLILDTKDRDADSKAHLKTLPALIGNNKTTVVAVVLSFLLAVASTLISIFTHAPFSFWLLTFVALFIDLYMIQRVRNGDKNGYLIAAGKLFLWLLVFLLSSALI